MILSGPFHAHKADSFHIDESQGERLHDVVVRAYGDAVVRVSVSFGDTSIPDDENVMLEWHDSLRQEALTLSTTENGWDVLDSNGVVRLHVDTKDPVIYKWSDRQEGPKPAFNATVYPDGEVSVPFTAYDTFTPRRRESLSLAYVERARGSKHSVFPFHAKSDEAFVGTGERFAKMDLSGQTIIVENADALGVNNRRAYKNVPFYISSRLYGFLVLTSAHVRLSLADISTRAAQGLVGRQQPRPVHHRWRLSRTHSVQLSSHLWLSQGCSTVALRHLDEPDVIFQR